MCVITTPTKKWTMKQPHYGSCYAIQMIYLKALTQTSCADQKYDFLILSQAYTVLMVFLITETERCTNVFY